LRGGTGMSLPSGRRIRTGPSTTRGPLALGVIIVMSLMEGIYTLETCLSPGRHRLTVFETERDMTTPRWWAKTVLVSGLLGLGVTPCSAQRVVWAEGGPLVLGDNGEGLATLQLGFRFTGAKPGQAHSDIALALLPVGVSSGALIGIGDFDVGYDAPLAPWASLSLRGGASTLFGVGGGGAGFALGYNAGGGLLFHDREGKQGARLDVTTRWLSIDGETYPLASLTLGFIILH
jgi:hypothetical protein